MYHRRSFYRCSSLGAGRCAAMLGVGAGAAACVRQEHQRCWVAEKPCAVSCSFHHVRWPLYCRCGTAECLLAEVAPSTRAQPASWCSGTLRTPAETVAYRGTLRVAVAAHFHAGATVAAAAPPSRQVPLLHRAAVLLSHSRPVPARPTIASGFVNASSSTHYTCIEDILTNKGGTIRRPRNWCLWACLVPAGRLPRAPPMAPAWLRGLSVES
jgi:hypothetical protein